MGTLRLPWQEVATLSLRHLLFLLRAWHAERRDRWEQTLMLVEAFSGTRIDYDDLFQPDQPQTDQAAFEAMCQRWGEPVPEC